VGGEAGGGDGRWEVVVGVGKDAVIGGGGRGGG